MMFIKIKKYSKFDEFCISFPISGEAGAQIRYFRTCGNSGNCRVGRAAHLHLDVEDAPLLLDLLLDGGHGLVEHRQPLCALQGGRRHHVARGSDQVDLSEGDTRRFTHK